MNSISFSIMNLTIASKTLGERFPLPDMSSFSGLLDFAQHTDKNTYYEFHSEVTQDYVWMYLNHGKSSPRNAELTNVQTGEKLPNSRTIDEAELTKQTFALYSFKEHLLYLSNIRVKKILQAILQSQLQTTVGITPMYVDVEEFISHLKEVESISFSHAYNLFSQNNAQRQALVDLTGVDAPESFRIEATYKKHSVVNFIRQLVRAKAGNELSGLVIRGRDDNQFEIVYNLDTFTRKIEIVADVDAESNMYDENEVREKLIQIV